MQGRQLITQASVLEGSLMGLGYRLGSVYTAVCKLAWPRPQYHRGARRALRLNPVSL